MSFISTLFPVDAEICYLPPAAGDVMLRVVDLPAVDNPYAKTLFLTNGAGDEATLALPARAIITLCVSETLLLSIFHGLRKFYAHKF